MDKYMIMAMWLVDRGYVTTDIYTMAKILENNAKAQEASRVR